MTYIRVKWNHTNPDEPIWLFSELDNANQEIRKMECFRSGFCDFATTDDSSGTTLLNTGPLPDISVIAKDPQFEPVEITKEEFEAIWTSRRYHAS
jgi:hypothetical protein